MKSIFKDNYLIPEFINPNYRGLEGWKCEVNEGCGEFRRKLMIVVKNSLLGLECVIKGKHFLDRLANVKIPQFTPKDIPVGELCWFSSDGVTWYKRSFGMFHTKISKYNFFDDEGNYWIHCVPYLVAETEKDAQNILDNTEWGEDVMTHWSDKLTRPRVHSVKCDCGMKSMVCRANDNLWYIVCNGADCGQEAI